MNKDKICPYCKKLFSGKGKRTFYDNVNPIFFCSDICKHKYYHENFVENTYNNVNRKYIGTISEFTVCIDLIKKGFEIYKNISPHGILDIIAYFPNTYTILKIEITTGAKNKRSGNRSYVKHDKYKQHIDVVAVVYKDMVIYYNQENKEINIMEILRKEDLEKLGCEIK